MNTFRQLEQQVEHLPLTTSWYLADLGEARGRQELFTRQSPQKLRVLREHALMKRAVSSNGIEGVQVDQARVGTVLFGKSHLRDRDQEEVRGYRVALKLIQEQGGLKDAGMVEALGRGPGRSGGREVVPFKRGNREGSVQALSVGKFIYA